VTTPGTRIDRCQLERRPVAVRTAQGRRAIEIASGIEGQAGERVSPVGAVDNKAMQQRFRPAPAPVGRQLEHCPLAVGTALRSRAVKVAGGIDDQAAERLNTVSVQLPLPLGVNSNAVPTRKAPPPMVVP